MVELFENKEGGLAIAGNGKLLTGMEWAAFEGARFVIDAADLAEGDTGSFKLGRSDVEAEGWKRIAFYQNGRVTVDAMPKADGLLYLAGDDALGEGDDLVALGHKATVAQDEEISFLIY